MNYTALVDHYGYLVLFIALMLELIIFGIPTEILMGYAGFLIFEGKLGFLPAILAAAAGSCIGISISYFIGKKLGYPFFQKYGHKIHMGPDRLDHFSHWFSKYGNGLIIIAYFIPGIRHVTGYFSGITKLQFRRFAPFAYLGAIIWVSVFISLGKILGPQWETFHNQIKKYFLLAGILLVVILALCFVYKRKKDRLFSDIKTIATHSPLQARISLIVTTIIFLGLFAYLIGLTQDYLANETTQFNQIGTLIIRRLFGPSFETAMNLLSDLANHWVLLTIALLTPLWILLFKHDRLIELLFTVITMGGGFLIVKALNYLFHLISPDHVVKGYPHVSFLNIPFLMALIIWGFFAYIIAQSRGFLLSILAASAILLIAFLLGISQIWFRLDPPSHVVTGVVFAGVWLSLNIILLDISRELRRIQRNKTT